MRGQLHKEFFYGCICRPGETGRIFVKRMEIAGKTVDDVLKFVDNIVDPVIRKIVTNRLVELKDLGIKDVAPGSITMASGVPINKARVKVRLSDPMVIRTHSHLSRSEYKNFIYAETGQGANFRLALFSDHNGYAAVPENALLWSKDHKKIGYEPLDFKPGFMGYVYPGSMTLALQYEGEDVSKCSIFELRKRLYTILSVGSEKEKRAEFRNALLAGQKKMLGKPVSLFSKDLPPNLLRMGPAKYLSQMLFEGIHFKMMLDGTIKFIER